LTDVIGHHNDPNQAATGDKDKQDTDRGNRGGELELVNEKRPEGGKNNDIIFSLVNIESVRKTGDLEVGEIHHNEKPAILNTSNTQGDLDVDVQIDYNSKPTIVKCYSSNIDGAFRNFMSGFRLYNEEGIDLFS